MMNGDLNQLQDGIPAHILTKVEKVLQPFRLSEKKLRKVSALFKDYLNIGLEGDAELEMLPTYVRAKPDGTEDGDFLALDLGGTNLRVLHVRVAAQEHKVQVMNPDEFKVPVPQDIRNGTGEQLFKYIADFLGDFLESQNLKGRSLPLGFSFSFPCKQRRIDEGILISWSKEYTCSGVEDEDVVELLRTAIQDRGDCDVGMIALTNDAVGTMMSCAYEDQSCEIGMIIGTGTNACYMEEMRNVKRVEGEDGRMCINTEWGGFGDDGSLKDIRTHFDEMVDKTSENSGKHKFEKMISGMYLGEVVRLVLVKLAEDKLLFKGQTSQALLTQWTFETKFMSEIEHQDNGLENAKRILTSLGLDWDEVDARVVRLVCDAISTRAAHLCAAALAAVTNHMRVSRGEDRLKTTVGVEGTVYRKHPNFSKKLQDAVRVLAPECDITFLDSEDGSGKGAALVVAVAQRLDRM